MTLRDRLAQPRIPTRYRIEGWMPVDARTMIVAQYKAGKTTLVGNLCRSLLDGDMFLGVAPVTPVEGVLVLVDTEMAPTQLDDWYRDQGISNDDRLVIITLRGSLNSFNLLDRAVRSKWAADFKARGAHYIILDCLRPVLDALGLDEQHDAGRFLVAFDELLREAEVHEAAVVHHMGHGGERARGDSRLRDWPDVEWLLVRETADPASPRYISAFGRDVNVAQGRLEYDLWRRLTLTNGTRQEAGLATALAAVHAALAKANSPLSLRDLQKALAQSEYPRDRVRAAIRHGVDRGEILIEKGPRNAHLHRLNQSIQSVPDVSHPSSDCAAVCDARTPHSPSECASASIEARTHTGHSQPSAADAGPHTPIGPTAGKADG
jgi:hypothetical protein